MTVHLIMDATTADWLTLRRRLWPHCSDDEHIAEMDQQLADPARYAQFISHDETGTPTGFAEASIRHDYVNGTHQSPVAFLEGIYVEASWRQNGIARQLVEAVSGWAQAHGISELASDAELDNNISHAVHQALGFEVTERVVFFRKTLTGE